MTDKTWKAVERRIAKVLGGKRNPLSGSSSRHTSGDVIHDKYYVEIKHRARIPFYNIFKDDFLEKKLGKKVSVLLYNKKSRYCILMIDLDDFVKKEIKVVEIIRTEKIPFFKTFKETIKEARKENKIPLVIFHEKGSKTNIVMMRLEDFIKKK